MKMYQFICFFLNKKLRGDIYKKKVIYFKNKKYTIFLNISP